MHLRPATYAQIEAIQKQHDEDGVDPATGEPTPFPDPRDERMELDGDMVFWVFLDQRLAGARHPDNGRLHPDAVENELRRRGIVEEQDRDVAWAMLDAMTAGRIDAENEKIDPERDRGGTKPHANPR